MNNLIKELRPFLGTPSYYHNPPLEANYHDDSTVIDLYNLFKQANAHGLYERDGQILEVPWVCPHLIDTLANPWLASHNVVDFGGSLGTSFWAIKGFYPELFKNISSWTVYELPQLVSLAKNRLSNNTLFFTDAISELPSHPTIILFSGVIQYLPSSLLDTIHSYISSSSSITSIVLDRTLSTSRPRNIQLFELDRTFKQPRCYACNAVSESLLISSFMRSGFKLYSRSTTLGGVTYTSRKLRLEFLSHHFTPDK